MYSQADKDGFFNAVDSLKKYRRAQLLDEEGNELIEELYTDLLLNEQVLKTCLKNNTTFLIGRRGTGKSTIFLRLQQEIRKKDNVISCYIDTKYIFESSKAEYVEAGTISNFISSNTLQKYLLERNFIKNILSDLRKEIDKRSYGLLERIKKLFGTDRSSIVKEKLQELYNSIENNEQLRSIELPLLQQFSTRTKMTDENSDSTSIQNSSKVSGSLTPKDLGINAEQNRVGNISNSQKDATEVEKQFSEIFLKVFQVKELVIKLKDILSLLEIQHLVILLDDFSEIDDQAMKVFVDVVLAPLNNWSDEFVKFKVAAYPNRVYYGKIDTGKIDIIDLDFYNLYSEVDRGTMEEKAIDFTKRLVEKRIEYFTEKPTNSFFDTKKEPIENYYELLFQISMNVPRIIGYILYFAAERTISAGTPINKAALEAASARYYERHIASFFEITTFSMMSFDEKISILQLKELLNKFTETLAAIRKRIVTGDLTGREYGERTNPHTSHFHLSPTYEKFLKTLELNFFISKYNEMSNRDGAKQSIYCLNYGLCVISNLKWGKPKGTEFRKYFIARPFDFNGLVDDFLKSSKRIVCTNSACNENWGLDQLPNLEFTKMKCPECFSPVEIVSTSDRLQAEIKKIDDSKLLPAIDFSFLYELNKAGKSLRPKEVAEELDCSYQLIAWKAKKLDEEKELIIRVKIENGKTVYELTEKAKDDYFS
jgi:energy-coupling factor transporter ATP-binding protein EcfA2